jgi:hypothetical protein
MRVFLLSCLAAVLIAACAAAVLNSHYVPSASSEAFSTKGTRI